MRLELVIIGIFLVMVSIPSYYYAPAYLTASVHTFIGSMSGGNMNSASILRQMGYPSLHQIMPIFQYSLVGLAVAGLGMTMFGVVAKKTPKFRSVKVVTSEPFGELRIESQSLDSVTKKEPQPSTGNETVGVVNDVLTKLETELKEMKMGYEDHRQQIESERIELEQKERERLAKIISAGEVLTKEIAPDRFNDRVKHYVELKNEVTGKPVDLSLLAAKFNKMRKTMGSNDEIFSV